MTDTTTAGQGTAPASQHQCPSCGREGRLYLTSDKPPRAVIGCADCDMAEDASGKWVFYVGGITVKSGL